MDTREFSENPETISSEEYISLSDIFFEDKSPLLVLVEDQEDKPFWHRLFSCVSDKYERIDVWPLKEASAHAMQQTDASGKPLTATGKDALMYVEGLCKTKVIAIDADLDLLTDYHNYSSRVRTDKYVIHTVYYSIENHLLTDRTIARLSIWKEFGDYATTINWSQYFQTFGDTIRKSVKLCLAHIVYCINNHQPITFCISDLRSSLGSIQYDLGTWQTQLCQWSKSFENNPQFYRLLQQCNCEFSKYNSWTIDDVLQNVQGHTLYEFMSQILTLHYGIERKNKETNIRNSLSGTQIKEEIEEFKRNIRSNVIIVDRDKGLIDNSIYSATQLDMTSPDIVAIQQQIMRIA